MVGQASVPMAAAAAAATLPERVIINNVNHILCKESNQYFPILEEDQVKDRKVQEIYRHHGNFAEYLVRFVDEPLDKRSWVKLKDAKQFFRIKLAIYQQIFLMMHNPSVFRQME